MLKCSRARAGNRFVIGPIVGWVGRHLQVQLSCGDCLFVLSLVFALTKAIKRIFSPSNQGRESKTSGGHLATALSLVPSAHTSSPCYYESLHPVPAPLM